LPPLAADGPERILRPILLCSSFVSILAVANDLAYRVEEGSDDDSRVEELIALVGDHAVAG
jgi:hypothetical protein